MPLCKLATLTGIFRHTFFFHGTHGIAYGAPGGPDQECDCEGSMVEGSELSLTDRTLMASLHFDSTYPNPPGTYYIGP